MFFHSLAYLAFFLIVFSVYWAVPWQKVRVWILLVASYYFYYVWSAELALLVASTTFLDYWLARGLDAAKKDWHRRLLLGANLTVNLGILLYFKYMNFFVEELGRSLDSLGFAGKDFLDRNFLIRDIIVPFGISFYTFEAISYCVDVYRRKIRAERSLPNFMLFILFFPHLVAGPIVRGGDFLPQTHRPKRWSWLRAQVGVEFFLMGLFKKLAIADRMALYSDPIFTDPASYSTGAIWLGVFAFAIRIYCDFSGYTDMAIGSAHLLGYKLTMNFNMPYLSKNVGEFWRRWHISLSSWLRDYVYIGLGGNRGGTWFIYRNLMLTMLLGGLWHGAQWSFVIWGALHGGMLVVHRIFAAWAKHRPKIVAALETLPGKAFRMGLTFFSVMMCWIFFQKSLSVSLTMLERMFTFAPGRSLDLPNRGLWYTVALMAVCHYLGSTGIWKRWSLKLPEPMVGVGYATALTVALMLAPEAGKAFIYFDF
ncbi:MBOAT family O-acyltransferase [Tuwongella immobilis]|uniref:MBOAT family protein n=1 Tax=Tuwongella immobilis TaxID=692036 RepID=A0A6C2YXZ2_9BACT|nr:MBOAT family protein [Tuwongella immobilis]VIP05662.1 membrane bound o-acyl transferase mboat family protein : Putative membrane protein involved in D-alanine export OS=Singulisphaera acidiphila (strain ATCC BAA-1392 / DSM 18658 / VKM B-2454 / MOB10) GN=Sinac_5818 PE=4 SV=1: MBOAT [Tuwongella immobilis]VTS08680.1 membrane bound o-acyl transferase mboat family protein : Putative membrane protein involved in D-alanine export OS=Singulisphaera acidiphila (strain ATCC BAA-1392 / DSM 18658 / VKM B-